MRTTARFLVLLFLGLSACVPLSTSTPVSVSTSTPVIFPTLTPENDKPPAVTFQVNDRIQTARTGTYCWTYQQESGDYVGACMDSIGISTPSTPMQVQAPVTGELRFASVDSPIHPSALVFPATPESEIAGMSEGLRLWNYPSEYIEIKLQPQISQPVTLDLDPGLYGFHVTADWGDKGNAGYGFLIEVTS